MMVRIGKREWHIETLGILVLLIFVAVVLGYLISKAIG